MNLYLEEIKYLQHTLETVIEHLPDINARLLTIDSLERSKNRMKNLYYPTDMDVPQRSDNETKQ